LGKITLNITGKNLNLSMYGFADRGGTGTPLLQRVSAIVQPTKNN